MTRPEFRLSNFLLATTALVAITAAPAWGADLAPVYKAPIQPTPFNWTGFYIGGHIGGAWGDDDWNNVVASSGASFFGHLGSLSATSALGGFQAGYNLQTGNWLWGVETSWSWTNLNGEFSSLASTALGGEVNFLASSNNINWIGDVTGKIGMTFDRIAWYAGGGAAWSREKDQLVGTSLTFGGQDVWDGSSYERSGWTLLTGVEYAFDRHWSARIQYNYYDFGTENVTLTRNPSPQFPLTSTFTMDTQLHVQDVTAAINYRF